MVDGTNIYTGFNNAASQGSRFAGTNATVRGASRTPVGVGNAPMATGRTGGQAAALPSPITWLIAALVLLLALKWLGEHPKTAINPSELHVGGYNVLTIWVIVVLSVVASKLIVNGADGKPRSAFASGPLAGLGALINAT